MIASLHRRVTGVCLLVVALLSSGALLSGCAANHRPVSTQTHNPDNRHAPGRLASFYDLQIGSCYDLLTRYESDIRLYDDCQTPHRYEVYAEANLPDSMGDANGERPPLMDIQDFVNESCTPSFEPYVGSPPERSLYGFTAVAPSQESWIEGDRHVLCVLEPLTFEPAVGSAKGTGK